MQREGNGKSKNKIYEIEKGEETVKTTTKSRHFDKTPQIAKYLTRSIKNKRPITKKVLYTKQIHKINGKPQKKHI